MLALSARLQTLLQGHKYRGQTLFEGCALAMGGGIQRGQMPHHFPTIDNHISLRPCWFHIKITLPKIEERLFSPTNQNFHQTRNHFLEG